MPRCKTDLVALKHISLAVPSKEISIYDELELFDGDTEYIEKVAKSAGLNTRRTVDDKTTASDLCFNAAQKILKKFDKKNIDGLIFVTETPDYIVPSTAYVLHQRLGLEENCAVFDVNLGCSGYVYGLWLAASMIKSGGCRNVLLLAGDTLSKTVHPKDRSVKILFGDGGSATLLAADESAPPAFFELKANGAGADKLIIPDGGFRNPLSKQSYIEAQTDSGIRSPSDIYMSGADIFSFSISRVPENIQSLLNYSDVKADDLDMCFLHQSNRYILNSIAKKIKIKKDKIPATALYRYGNLSCASIPSVICTHAEEVNEFSGKSLLCGYGVGLSWGSAIIDFKNISTCITEVDCG